MNTTFTTALSAMDATSAAVDIVGNNLANLNTTGYKAMSAQFSDIMGQVMANDAEIGHGVGPVQSVRQFSQGSIQQTTGGLDAAIQGNGFFVVRDSANHTLFTRDGHFVLDSSGHLQTASGEYVQGWSAVNGVLSTNSAVGDIVVPFDGVIPATATQNITLSVNLDASGVAGQDSGVYAAPIQVVDSLGAVHTLTVTFTKTDVNKWDYAVTIPSADLANPADPPEPVAKGSLVFDGTGALTSPAESDAPIDIAISGLADGANDVDVKWNLFQNGAGQLTQFAQASSLAGSTQDGVTAGQINSVGLSDGGMVVATFSNGQQTTVGQLALASIQNPDTLVSVGNNNLKATAETATPAIGPAATGGRGEILGSSLESSTVDIATEFTNLITYQRSYQANARVISTADQMTQDLLTLIR